MMRWRGRLQQGKVGTQARDAVAGMQKLEIAERRRVAGFTVFLVFLARTAGTVHPATGRDLVPTLGNLLQDTRNT
jgi:hypothetical protein